MMTLVVFRCNNVILVLWCFFPLENSHSCCLLQAWKWPNQDKRMPFALSGTIYPEIQGIYHSCLEVVEVV